MGRDRPPPARSSRQADRALQRGDHLPRPREQPRQPALRRPSHRPGIRAGLERQSPAAGRRPARRAASSTRCTPAAASRRSTTPAYSRRRCRGSTLCAAAVPGTTARRIPTIAPWTRSRSRPARPGLKEDPQPGPNPFTPLAIQFWEDAIDAGGRNANRIAAVGSSDSHNAGRTPDPVTQSPIGQATTVVYADELSERGIQRGVEARHTYVKVFGNDGPDLRFEARPPGSSGPPAIMGDAVPGGGVEFTARVIGAGPGAARPGSYTLFVLKDGAPLLSVPVTSDDFSFDFPEAGPGRYRLQVQRESAIEAVSSPIWVESAAYPRPAGASPLRVSLVPAYEICDTPDREHGPPLAFGSCNPPVAESQALTVGTPDANGQPSASVASARLGVRPGDPRTSADEADVTVSVTAGDVRERATLEDHTGDAHRARLPADHRPRQRDPARRRQRARDCHRHAARHSGPVRCDAGCDRRDVLGVDDGRRADSRRGRGGPARGLGAGAGRAARAGRAPVHAPGRVRAVAGFRRCLAGHLGVGAARAPGSKQVVGDRVKDAPTGFTNCARFVMRCACVGEERPACA